ncbi:MAG: PAS domain-containing protein, partial [Ginsengibacter sp.]
MKKPVTLSQPADDLNFLRGGGEMGKLTREKDWSATPVGTPESWPQSLRTTLSILLNSKFPMFLWWGPELICFYNDAYRPSLGKEGKHPGILGMTAEKAWPEIWAIIKPLIDQVLTTGEATYSEDQLIPIYRNGKIEDVYWTFSYSSVNDESGKPAGVFVTCSETTGKVNALNEIKESKNQLLFAIDAAELGTWDLNPATNKFIGNDRLKEWFGLKPEDEIDLTIALAVIADDDRQRVIDAIQTALQYSSGGLYEIAYKIMHPLTKAARIVRAKGRARFDENQVAVRFNGTMQDITARSIAKRKTEESEKRFRDVVKQAPLGITILRGPEFIVEMANENYLRIVDRNEADFVGRQLFETLPEVKEAIEPLLNKVLNTGEPYYGIEFPILLNRFGKKELTYFNFVYHPLRADNNEISGIIVVATDVTASVNARFTLAESEKQFRNLVMQSPIPMTIFTGPDYVIELANKNMIEKVWRKKEADVIG